MKKEVYGLGLELYGKDFRSSSKLPSDVLVFKDRFFKILMLREDLPREGFNPKYKVLSILESTDEKGSKSYRISEVLGN